MRYARIAAAAAALALVVAGAGAAAADPIDIGTDPKFVVGNTVWDLWAMKPPTIQNVWIYEEGTDPMAPDADDHLVNHASNDLWWATFVGGTPGHYGDLAGSMVWDVSETAEGDIVLLGPVERLDGLDVRVEYRFYADGDLVRVLVTYANPSAAPVTVRTGTGSSVGGKALPSIAATSSGDTAVSTADRWMIVDDGGAGAPIVTMVWRGPDAELTPDQVTAESGEGDVELDTAQDLTVAPGDTVHLAYFTQVTGYEFTIEAPPTPAPGLEATVVLSDFDAAVAAATTSTSEFASFAGRLTAGLATGTEVLNWGTVGAAPPATPVPGRPSFTG